MTPARARPGHMGTLARYWTVRTTPLIGRKAWFGPRRLGWGLGPVSAEGWLLTVAFTALALTTSKRTVVPRWARYPILGAFLVFMVLKGTSPGGARARADFDSATAATTAPTGSGSPTAGGGPAA
jgi:hypothetical protein